MRMIRQLQVVKCCAVAVIATCLPQAGFAADEGKASLEVYGFGQVDYIQDFRRVNPAWADTLRPSRIPTQAGQFGSDGQAILSPRQSRFGAKSSLPVEDKSLKTQFEFDLFGVGVDEGQTTIRLRHAYGEWGPWLGGQTHSLFMDIDAFPNVIDYWGPAGMAFFRTPQIRFTPVQTTNTRLAFAIEYSKEDIDPGNIRELDPNLGVGPSGTSNIQGDNKVPDFTAQARVGGDWGHVQLGGIARRLGYETLGTADNVPKGFAVGWGLDLTTSLKYTAKSRVILSGLVGQGIANYMNDGGTDLAPEIQDNGAVGPKAVPLFGVMAYVDHYWTDQWSSTVGYARTQVKNTNFQQGSAFHSGEYASANLLYSPHKNLLYGIEGLWGRRRDNDGATGNDIRTQVTMKYSFSGML